MTEQDDFSAIDAVTHGDPRAARELRANIAVIARRTDDPGLRELCLQVLAGRESVRRVFAHPTFWQMAGQSLDNLEEGLGRLTDEEREDVMGRVGVERTSDAEIDALREGDPVPDADQDPDDEGPDDDGPPEPRDLSPRRFG